MITATQSWVTGPSATALETPKSGVAHAPEHSRSASSLAKNSMAVLTFSSPKCYFKVESKQALKVAWYVLGSPGFWLGSAGKKSGIISAFL
jgi:hypothetical protein